MHRERRVNNIVLFCLFLLLTLMSVGYASFQSHIEVKGTSKVDSKWDIEITEVSVEKVNGNAENFGISSYDKLSVSLEANLYEVGDSVEYNVTIKNSGTIKAYLSEITKPTTNAITVSFDGIAENDELNPNDTIVIKVTVAYNPEYTGGEITEQTNAIFNFIQA